MGNIFLSNRTQPSFLKMVYEKAEQANSILISVSFIKLAGWKLISKALINALDRGADVKLITSTYKNFTDPSVLLEANALSLRYVNFQCKLDHQSFDQVGFHTKGYVFKESDKASIIVGSTNLTRSALLTNFEWNAYVETNLNDSYLTSIEEEFEYLWKQVRPLSESLIKEYELLRLSSYENWDMDYELSRSKVQPNKMQERALLEINKNRKDKALVVAAMGTGKTYLAAMDAKAFGAKKVLFVVHRENILDKAIEAFLDIFGKEITYSKYLGSQRNRDADFIFTTNLTINNDFNLFDRYAFDYIIIDEVHHAAAGSYKALIDYFKPDFLLGLTATPERMDQRNIYALFDYIVPFEIRLREAIENDIIVPFQYYGIRNKHLNYDENHTKREFNLFLKEFASPKNVQFIIEEINKYKVNGKPKIIAFCPSVDHAKLMAEAFSNLGLFSIALTGENSAQERNRAFQDLAIDTNSLKIICTVDILNEGIDIPAVNMVLFLRPTESVTIFIQQLGRGLRKYPNKDYLVVLDFIGNAYKRSVYIAKALGTMSNVPLFNKKHLVNLIKHDFNDIKIRNFKVQIDPLSKEEILSYLEKINENSKEYLKQDYLNFKSYLGLSKPPKHIEFLDVDRSPDLVRFIRATGIGRNLGNSYYAYLESIGESTTPFNDEQVKLLNFLSYLLPLIRIEEFFIVSSLLQGPKTEQELTTELQQLLKTPFDPFFSHALRYMMGNLSLNAFETKECVLSRTKEGRFQIKADLTNLAFKDHLIDLLTYGLQRFEKENGLLASQFYQYQTYFNHQFMLAMCETYLNYQKGTMIKNDKVYIFTNLNKEDQDKEDLKYHDAFLDPKTFEWESKIDVTMDSKEGKKLIQSKEAHLFVRAKSKTGNLTMPMIYLGKGKLTNPQPHHSKKTISFKLALDESVPQEIYEELKHAHE
jgi:superfamily II DNA or RNA helicase